MTIKNQKTFLPLVEKPSRYLGTEINSIKKNFDLAKLRFALAFPDLYEIGTSHFGIQILYNILNSQDEICAERVFAPGIDMEKYLKADNTPLTSLESRKPLASFDIIGFSLLYELNFTNILTILDLAKIPFMANERDECWPLIIGGGPCTCNPEPVADFFDVIVVGDGEDAILEISKVWMEWKQHFYPDKAKLLELLSVIQGVYVPSFFDPLYDASGFQILKPKRSDYTGVTRAVIDDLDKSDFPTSPVIPFGRPVHDRLRIEIARGCTRGCRFCQAGMIYRPVRERSVDKLLKLTDLALSSTGYDEVSLLSLSTGDYVCIEPLLKSFMEKYADKHIAVSLPSLRADSLTPDLINLVKKVRKTGFTIAVESGSQRLRDVINKNISRQQIIDTVANAFKNGWRIIKLYFMTGLPTETDDDLHSIVDLVKDVNKIKNKNCHGGKINVSVTTFIPKPHTPFQWASQICLEESVEKIKWLKNSLNIPGIQFKWQNPEVSILEGLWARGDRRLSRLLLSAYKKGCRFDGWSDMFNYGLWKEAIAQDGIDIDFFTTRKRDISEPLPWDHVNINVDKKFLKQEWEKALKCEATYDCRTGDCNNCGVCDFVNIKPIISEVPEKILDTSSKQNLQPENLKETNYKKFEVSYSKLGEAKYFGHLEVMNIFLRSIKRADIPVKFSRGFHPKPKISFDDPLPVGMESHEELLYITVPESINPEEIVTGMNKSLPEGLDILKCRLAPGKSAANLDKNIKYSVTLKEAGFNEKDLIDFNSSSQATLSLTSKKGKKIDVNLKSFVVKINIPDQYRLEIILKTINQRKLRPLEVIKKIFNLTDENLSNAIIIKKGFSP